MYSTVKKNASIRKQITIRFSVICATLLIASAVFLFSISKISLAQEHANGHQSNKIQFQQAVSDHYQWAFQLISSVAFQQEFTGTTDPKACHFGKFIYSDVVQSNPEWREFLSEVEPLHNRLHQGAHTISTLVTTAEIEQVYANEILPVINELVEILNQETAFLDVSIAESQQEEKVALRNQVITLISLIAVLLVSLILVFGYVSRHIVTPILHIKEKSHLLAEGILTLDFTVDCKNSDLQSLADSLNHAVAELENYVQDISRAMGEMSHRNLDIRPTQSFLGEFKPIETSIAQMIVDLSAALRQIETASNEVTAGSVQVSDGAQSLAHGSTIQASSVEELVASVAEVSNQIVKNANNATRAGEMAQNTSSFVASNHEQMQKLMVSMNEIDAGSRQISNIIKTIEDIAFQTNILALNAAVEAARAGSAGKGFAVVADEVRNLAGKSAQAAQTTTELIESSVRAIRSGVSLAQEMAADMDQVVESANETSAVISEIARATQEQADALDQINMGLEHISSVVQENSATSEESAAASSHLSTLAADLRSLIRTFKLNNQEAAAFQQ